MKNRNYLGKLVFWWGMLACVLSAYANELHINHSTHMEFLVDRGNVVTPVQSGAWSDPATWGGVFPQTGDSVNIPPNIQIVVDQDPPQLNSVFVLGVLNFDENVAALEMRQKWLAVGMGGLLEIGTEENPYPSEVTLTFYGTDESENIMGEGIMAHGTKGLYGMRGGQVEIHGASRDKVNWTQINAHANPGDTSITLKEVVNWEVGDLIVIAASGWDPQEAEQVEITEVSGNVVHFTPALQHRHWGTIQQIPGETTGEIFSVDQRAEVGLLTRNIVIQGAEDSYEGTRSGIASKIYPWSYDYGFGAHSMFMPTSIVHMEGVEFFRCGQTGHKARYPFHWHLGNDVQGQYVRNCSVRDSFQRAFVVHGTHNALVENNVAYNVLNHAYITEDGTETGNKFLNNLCVLTYTPEQVDFAFFNPKVAHGRSEQSELRAANFWMVNGLNEVRGNHAAGAFRGIGFFWDHQTVTPGRDTPIKNFSDNVAHSCFRPKPTGRDLYGPMERGFGLMFRWKVPYDGDVVVENFFAYKCSNGGIWAEDEKILDNCLLADNKFGIHIGLSAIKNSVIIGETANDIGGSWPANYGGVLVSHKGHNIDEQSILRVHDTTFLDMQPAGITSRSWVIDQPSSLKGLRYIRTNKVNFTPEGVEAMGFNLLDEDGSTSGQGPDSRVLSDNPITRHADSTRIEGHNAQFSKNIGQMLVRLRSLTDQDIRPNSRVYPIYREDGVKGHFSPNASPDRQNAYGWVLPGYAYDITFAQFTGAVQVRTDYGNEDGAFIMGVPFDTAQPVRVYREAYSVNSLSVRPHLLQPITQVASMEALRTSDTSSYYVEAARNLVHLKLKHEDSLIICDDAFIGEQPTYAWFRQHFGRETIMDNTQENLWGQNADPDEDGLSNAWEMVLGTHPRIADSDAAPFFDFSALPSRSFAITYTESKSIPDSWVFDSEYALDPSDWRSSRVSSKRLSDSAERSTHQRTHSRLKVQNEPIYARLLAEVNFSNGGGSKAETDVLEWVAYSQDSQPTPLPITTDSIAPTVPSGLTPVALSPYQVELSWSAAQDASNNVTYEVRRDGVLVHVTKTLSILDRNLLPEQTYTYRVEAVDPAGNRSGLSLEKSVTTLPVTSQLASAKTLVHFDFEEGSGNIAYDLNDNTLQAILENGAAFVEDSERGNIVEFTGTQPTVNASIDVPEEQLALTFWFKTTQTDAGLFASADRPFGKQLDRQIYLSGGNLSARMLASSNRRETISSEGVNYADGLWHHLVYTHGPSIGGQKLYVDGILVAEGTEMNSRNDRQAWLQFGYSGITKKDSFNGQIDEVKIYRHALQAEDVAYVFNPGSGDAGPEPQSPTVASFEILDSNTLRLIFDQAVDKTTAEQISHYLFDPNLTVLSAALSEDGQTVILTVQGLIMDTEFALAINGVASEFDGTLISNDLFSFDSGQFEPGALDSAKPQGTFIEFGEVAVLQRNSQEWHTVEFSESFENPVVVMGPPSVRGGQPSTVRVRNVSTQGFEFQIDEWDYLDGFHLTETLHWLALEAGSYDLDTMKWEAGYVEAVTHDFKQVDFEIEDFGQAPVVLAQVVTTNEASAVTSRLRGITASEFQVKVQEEEGLRHTGHAGEQVAYIALSVGSGNVLGMPFLVTSTEPKDNSAWRTIDFRELLQSTSPALFANIQSTHDDDTVILRYRNLGNSKVELKMQEERSGDKESRHGAESMGVLMLGFEVDAE